MEIINVGDIHIKHEYPFSVASERFVDWFCNQDFNNENNIVVFSGDILDKSISSGEVNSLMTKLFSRLKFKIIYVITGNHDLSRTKGSGLRPLDETKNIHLIERPEVIIIQGIKTVMLPYYYPYTLKGYSNMEKDYTNLPDEFKDADIMYGHFTDETQSMFGEGIDVSYLNPKLRLLGHIHHKSKNYLGTPLITRSDEAHKKSFISLYDVDTKKIRDIEVPVFLDYDDINFDKLSSYKTKDYPVIYDIYDIPSIEAFSDIPKKIIVRNRFVKNYVSDEIMNLEDLDLDRDLVKYMNKFCDAFNVNNSLRFKLLESVREKETI